MLNRFSVSAAEGLTGQAGGGGGGAAGRARGSFKLGLDSLCFSFWDEKGIFISKKSEGLHLKNTKEHVLYAVSALKLDAALCWTIHADKDSK